MLLPPRALELLLSSRGLIAINRGLVGFGFVAIASDIHACTQSRCLTGAHACKRVGSVVASHSRLVHLRLFLCSLGFGR